MTILVTANGADRSHIERRKAILAKYPQARELFGRDETTFKITAAIFLGQLTIAAFLGWLGLSHWPLTLLFAICVGAFANHANFVIIHDAIHNCVFESISSINGRRSSPIFPTAFPRRWAFAATTSSIIRIFPPMITTPTCRAAGRSTSSATAAGARRCGCSSSRRFSSRACRG